MKSRRALRSLCAAFVTFGLVAGLGASASAAEKVTEAKLGAALLGLSDMPTGWSSYPIPASDTKPANTGACNKANSFARAQKLRSSANAQAAFVEDPQSGPLVAEAAFAFPSVKAAQKMMTAPDFSCGTFEQDHADGTTTHYDTLGLMSFPKVGDQSVAWRDRQTNKKGSLSGTPIVQESVAFRVGKVVAVVTRSATSSDTDQLQKFVGTATEKMSSLAAT
jgi:hypothetical protein